MTNKLNIKDEKDINQSERMISTHNIKELSSPVKYAEKNKKRGVSLGLTYPPLGAKMPLCYAP